MTTLTEPTDQQLLDAEFDSDDLGERLSIRAYMKRLLSTLFEEVDGFSGKRPFGNSGWWVDLGKAWMDAGYLEGKYDADGYIEDYDDETYDKYIKRCIEAL